MTYTQAEQWLFSQLPNYQNQGKIAYKPGLDNILALSESLENPHTKFKSIHVAGTNGKGSTSHMLSSILQESGYKVGLFTSPHLKNFTERIKINGVEFSKEFVTQFVEKIKKIPSTIQPSFFEITTLMAFEYFAQEKVDIAIIETGLGGRLDASNIIMPEISAITSISYDHQDILGNTLEAICLEKCGIIKPNIPVVNGETNQSLKEIILKKSAEKKAKFIDATSVQLSYECNLKGEYQTQNQKTVFAVCKELLYQNWNISEENIKNGFLNVVSNTGLRARWEVFNENPKVVLDVAHNEAGIKSIIHQISTHSYQNIKIIIGFVKGKEVEKIVSLLPKNAQYYFVQPSNSRGLSPLEYQNVLDKYQLNYSMFSSVQQGYKEALETATNQDFILVTGSNFVIADIL